jgi:AcrR family transcriptional regulator
MQENTEQKILDAAIDVFVRKGFSGARMQEIADQAGINKSLLHYYFRSKKALFRIIIEKTFGELIPQFSQAINSDGTVLQKFESVIKKYIQALRNNPHLPLFILHELSQNRAEFVEEMKAKATNFPDFQRFFKQMMEEMAAGTIRAYNPMHLFMNIASLCVFPFAARPVFKTLVGMPEELFDQLMQDREKEVINFVRNALRP